MLVELFIENEHTNITLVLNLYNQKIIKTLIKSMKTLVDISGGSTN